MMKKFALLLLAGITAYAATYESLTVEEAKSGVAGFKEQFLKIADDTSSSSDIIIGTSRKITNNTTLLTQTEAEAKNSQLSKIDWCTNGMTRVKIYIPPYLNSFQVAMQYLPINNGLMYATFKPIGTIDESSAVSADEAGTTFYDRFWADHETILVAFKTSFSFVMNSYVMNKYGIDNTTGGYLYLSFVQSDNIISDKKFDPRYSMSFSIYYDFINPLTPEMKQQILSQIPEGRTEPVEMDQTLISNECSQYSVQNGVANFTANPFAIQVEDGVPIDPQQACESQGSSYQYINNKCYDTSSQVYTCEITDGGRWSGRCISPAEDTCNASSLTHWYVGGEQCLDTYDHISNAANFSDTPKSLTLVQSSNGIEAGVFQANEEGWLTQLTLKNLSTTASKVESVTINGHAGQTLIDAFDVTLPASKSSIVEISRSGGKMSAKVYDESGVQISAHEVATSETNGSVVIATASSDTVVDLAFGTNLNSVAASQSGGGSGGSDGLVINVPTSSSSSSTASTGGSGGGAGDGLSITTPTSSTSSAATAGGGGDNLSITGPTASSSSAMTGGAASSEAAAPAPEPAYDAIEEKLKVPDETFEIAGWLYHYDFKDVNGDYDYVYNSTKNGMLYRLKPTTGEELKWAPVKGITLEADQKILAFVLAGDWDRDGKGKNDWVVIKPEEKKAYNFRGNIGAGKIGWGSEPLPVTITIDGSEVTFK